MSALVQITSVRELVVVDIPALSGFRHFFLLPPLAAAAAAALQMKTFRPRRVVRPVLMLVKMAVM